MVPWFSEDTMTRLRRLLDLYRRHTGMSLDALAANLGAGAAGPSASTLGRFLNVAPGAPGGELSVRHIREVLQNLEHLLTVHSPNGEIFIKACGEDLAFFGLLGQTQDNGAASMPDPMYANAEDQALQHQLRGTYLIARAFESGNLIFSFAEFAPVLSNNGAVGCTIHRVVRAARPVQMRCDVSVLNRLLYLRGLHPLNRSVRFMCLSACDLDAENFIGFLTGFESPDVSFSSKCLMSRTAPGVELAEQLTALHELNTRDVAEARIADIAASPDAALALLGAMASDGYARIEPAYI